MARSLPGGCRGGQGDRNGTVRRRRWSAFVDCREQGGVAVETAAPLSSAGGSRVVSIRTGQDGGASSPLSTQAACRAAPARRTHPARGSPPAPRTGRCDRPHGADADAPPMSRTRPTGTPSVRRSSTPATRLASIPSTAARARFSGVELPRVMPPRVPVASGRLGVRSPSR